jgi:UDP-N-acetylglucosamine:LPS N-acetylglucosamine transferase
VPVSHRYLILSASMGAGHDGVARELAGRLTARGEQAEVLDLLSLLPLGAGRALRGGYQRMLAHAPWLYEAIYRGFFALDSGSDGPALSTGQPAAALSSGQIRENGSRGGAPRAGRQSAAGPGPALDTSATAREAAGGRARRRPSTSPVVLAALPGLRSALAAHRPDAVVSTFHLCAQAAGRLRQRGELAGPSLVVLTDFALNRVWRHPGTDFFLAPSAAIAAQVAQDWNLPASSVGPVVSERFHAGREQRATRPESSPDAAGRREILVAGGAWGVGEAVERVARTLAASGRYLPVVLCGRNQALRRRLAGRAGVRAVGWTDQVPALMARASALVENAGGVTATEAFAAGLPVVTHRPIPGHGRDAARRLAAAGLVSLSHDDAGLLAALDALCRPGPVREARVRAAAELFTGDPARQLADVVAGHHPAPRDAASSH